MIVTARRRVRLFHRDSFNQRAVGELSRTQSLSNLGAYGVPSWVPVAWCWCLTAGMVPLSERPAPLDETVPKAVIFRQQMEQREKVKPASSQLVVSLKMSHVSSLGRGAASSLVPSIF